MMEKKEFDVDQALNRMEAINKKLAEKEISLQESLELYKEGALLAGQCKEHLTGIEKELIIMNQEQKI